MTPSNSSLQPDCLTLNQLAFNKVCRVFNVRSDNPEIQSRLMSLGLYPGVQIKVLRKAPLGDPLQVRVGATLMSIRLKEAQLIEVKEGEK